MLRVSFNNVFISFTTNNNKKHIKKGRPNGNNNNNFYTGNFFLTASTQRKRKKNKIQIKDMGSYGITFIAFASIVKMLC